MTATNSVASNLSSLFRSERRSGIPGIPSRSLLAQPEEDFAKPTFNDDGELIRPDISYREWVYIGTPLTPNDLNPPEAPFPEGHNVYIHPDDFDHWKRTGTFRNGTVIVKELVSVGTKQAVSGNGHGRSRRSRSDHQGHGTLRG